MDNNNIEQLKDNIREYIKQNGNKEITGQILQDVLLGMVDGLVGNDAVANPEGEAAEILEKIGIAGINYTAPQGPQGVSPTVQVTQSENGYHVVITDKDGAHAFDLTNGPANTLTIGTVTDGEQAAAEITGEAPNQQLNLVLPKGEQGDPGQNAVNPFKGWFTTANIPTTGQEGDYCYVSDSGTTKVWRWNPNSEPPAFEETTDTPDTDHTQSFASSESVNEVAIDDSHLVNPVNTADETKPVLVRAEDVMPIKAITEGTRIVETKLDTTAWHPDGEDYGWYTDDGVWHPSVRPSNIPKYSSSRVDVSEFDGVRFLGIDTSTTMCYAFTKSDGSFVEGYPKHYDNTSNVPFTKEYSLPVPHGAKYLVFLIKYASLLLSKDAYCYGRVGETILDKSLRQAKEAMVFETGQNLRETRIAGNLYDEGLMKSDNFVKNVVINNRRYVYSASDYFNDAISSVTKKWAGPNSYDACLQIAVKKGSIIKINSTETTTARYALLSSKVTETIAGQQPDYLDGESLNILAINSEVKIVVPSDCYLYVHLGITTSSYSPYPFAPKKIIIGESINSKAEYDNTWMEAPFFKSVLGRDINNTTGAFISKSGNRLKFYALDKSKDYRLIYQIKTDDASYHVYFFNMGENLVYLGGFGAAETSQVETTEVMMEPLDELTTIPENANTLVLSYPSTSNAALMVAADCVNIEQKLKSNYEHLYFVSKIRKGQIPNGYVSNEHEDVTTEVWSAWALNLPESYAQVGRKTPIYAAFHGTNGIVTTETMSYDSWKDLVRKPFNDEGIATLDINGYGVSFSSGTRSQHWGCPEAVETVRIAFDFCKQYFNVCDKMVLGGLSMAGAICTTYAKTYPSDVLAVAVMAPTNLILTALYQSGDYVQNTAKAWGYNTTADMRQDNASNMIGYAPFCVPFFVDASDNSVKKMLQFPANELEFRDDDTLIESFPVPLMVWHGTADNNVKIERSRMLVNAIRRKGGNARLRECQGLDHYQLTSTPWVVQEVIDYVKTCFAK